METNKAYSPDIMDKFSALIGFPVVSVENISRGRNGRVYRLECSNGKKYAVKEYYRDNVDSRDRLYVEYNGLEFLWRNGIRDIPRPIVSDFDQGYAIYEYIEGARPSSEDIELSDVEHAVRFLGALKELKGRKGSSVLPEASEACFSIEAIIYNIESRLQKLINLPTGEILPQKMRSFSFDSFIPLFNEVKMWCYDQIKTSGISYDAELSIEERTLSPSDFGFHNALKNKAGKITFLDFEYFGWDDPAKMISDFLLHPAMDLREDLKKAFIDNILNEFKEYSCLRGRVEIVYPLFGLKWCMILLNEFLPENLSRRMFAREGNVNRKEILKNQLFRAEKMCQKVRKEYKYFSYW